MQFKVIGGGKLNLYFADFVKDFLIIHKLVTPKFKEFFNEISSVFETSLGEAWTNSVVRNVDLKCQTGFRRIIKKYTNTELLQHKILKELKAKY